MQSYFRTADAKRKGEEVPRVKTLFPLNAFVHKTQTNVTGKLYKTFPEC